MSQLEQTVPPVEKSEFSDTIDDLWYRMLLRMCGNSCILWQEKDFITTCCIVSIVKLIRKGSWNSGQSNIAILQVLFMISWKKDGTDVGTLTS